MSGIKLTLKVSLGLLAGLFGVALVPITFVPHLIINLFSDGDGLFNAIWRALYYFPQQAFLSVFNSVYPTVELNDAPSADAPPAYDPNVPVDLFTSLVTIKGRTYAVPPTRGIYHVSRACITVCDDNTLRVERDDNVMVTGIGCTVSINKDGGWDISSTNGSAVHTSNARVSTSTGTGSYARTGQNGNIAYAGGPSVREVVEVKTDFWGHKTIVTKYL